MLNHPNSNLNVFPTAIATYTGWSAIVNNSFLEVLKYCGGAVIGADTQTDDLERA